MKIKDIISEGEVVGFKPKSNTKAADDIEKSKYTGNTYNDGELMQKIHCFIMDPKNSMEDKMRALAKLDEIMGVDNGMVTPRDVQLYMQNEDPPEDGECKDPEPFVPYPDSAIPGKPRPKFKVVK
jgi:hypothetical protein